MKTSGIIFSIAVGSGITLLATLEWDDAYHLFLAFVALAVIGLMLLIWRRMRRARRVGDPVRTRRHKKPSVIRAVAVGLLLAGAWASVLGGLVQVADRFTHLEATFIDRDRAEFERLLDGLERGHSHAEAARLIETRLEKPLTRMWKRDLALRLYTALIHAGTNAAADSQSSFFERAMEVAKKYDLDVTAARSSLELAKQRKLLADGDAQARAIEDRIRADAAEKLRGVVKEWVAYALRVLLQCGDLLGRNLQGQRDCYQAAVTLAQQHGLDPQEARAKLIETEKRLADARPVDLPVGARAILHSAELRLPLPLLQCEISVLDAEGNPIESLLAKDFQLRLDGKESEALRAVRFEPSTTPRQVVVLLDRSASTAAVAPAVTAACSKLLGQLRGIGHVRVLAFHSDSYWLTEWLADPQAATSRLSLVAPAGNTALYLALSTAIRELADRPAPREIVLFTDGQNNVPGPAPETLIADCRKHDVRVNVVALETGDLDKQTLNNLALQTGGMFATTSSADQLHGHFGRLGNQMRTPRYWVGGFVPEGNGPVTMTIGSKNPVTLNIKPSPGQDQEAIVLRQDE